MCAMVVYLYEEHRESLSDGAQSLTTSSPFATIQEIALAAVAADAAALAAGGGGGAEEAAPSLLAIGATGIQLGDSEAAAWCRSHSDEAVVAQLGVSLVVDCSPPPTELEEEEKESDKGAAGAAGDTRGATAAPSVARLRLSLHEDKR